MQEQNIALKARFFGEIHDYIAQAGTLLETLGKDASSVDSIHELFRCIHSVKSESMYLKFSGVGEIAHRMENRLEEVRKNMQLIDTSLLNGLEEQLEQLSVSVTALESQEEKTGASILPVFNLFERKLLDEAQKRGEVFFCIRCEFDPETPMKKARAYLILNNLEQMANVIQTEPSIRTEDDEAFALFSLYVTADVDQSILARELEIDQVLKSSIDVVNYSRVDAEGGSNGREVSGLDMPSLYRLSDRLLNQLTGYTDEIRLNLRELDLDVGQGDPQKIKGQIARLSRLSQGLHDELRQIRTAKMAEEYERLQKLSADLGDQLGKQIYLDFAGSDVEIDRRVLMVLGDPLNHLVRNAIDHGIESLPERKRSGKGDKGTLTIRATDAGDQLLISFADDGRGIDEDAVRDAAPDVSKDASLLEIVSAPGFTTLSSATKISGRGVGLDLVVQRISSVGGEISLENRPGKGVALEIALPKVSSYSQLLFFRFGPQLYAVPNRAVVEIEKLTKGDLKRSAAGRVYFRASPAFIGEQAATVQKKRSFGSFAIVVSGLGEKGCFLADDVLFEHEVPEDLIRSAGEGVGKKRFAVRLGTGKQEFLYLSPSLFSSGASG